MLGRVEFASGGRGRVEYDQLYGLSVLRARVDPEARLTKRRLERAGRQLRGMGAVHTLLPPGFEDEQWLGRMGLRRVDCSSFLQEQAPALTVEVLRRRDLLPGQACVAVRGNWVDGRMTRAVARMCAQVRYLVVDVPRGGEELGRWLRREFGIAVLPGTQKAQLAVRFQPGGDAREEVELELYGHRPKLDGVRLCVPRLAREEQEDLELLSVLWARGKIEGDELKFT